MFHSLKKTQNKPLKFISMYKLVFLECIQMYKLTAGLETSDLKYILQWF